jgi:hypothetical protein
MPSPDSPAAKPLTDDADNGVGHGKSLSSGLISVSSVVVNVEQAAYEANTNQVLSTQSAKPFPIKLPRTISAYSHPGAIS